jgi:4-carboxymuconolactone decarboxylase
MLPAKCDPARAVAIGLKMAPWWLGKVRKDMPNLDYKDRLRGLALNDSSFAEALPSEADTGLKLDPKTLALVRIAALVAVGGPVPSFGEHADAAWAAGATGNEIVDVLVGLVPVLGLPCVVAAAPKMALALGYDVEDTF